ncbi:MAG: polysaccharide deacetylase family protein, partial [Mycobacteriales bacterium]
PWRFRRAFLVTIDDGYVSTLQLAAPLLAARGVPAVLFVPAGLIGGRSEWMPAMAGEPLLDAAGLRTLAGTGVEVGAHGLDHRSLVGLSPAELHEQTVRAGELLAEVVGARPRAFAYPSGLHDAAAVAAVASAGYAVAFTADARASADRHRRPRVDLNRTDSRASAALKCSLLWPEIESLGRRLPRLRATAHRVLAPTTARPSDPRA